MIIILALLNDLPIMTIAYDHARTTTYPVRWQMTKVLSIALCLGLFGVLSSFVLFWLGRYYWLLDAKTLQTLIFLKMTVSQTPN